MRLLLHLRGTRAILPLPSLSTRDPPPSAVPRSRRASRRHALRSPPAFPLGFDPVDPSPSSPFRRPFCPSIPPLSKNPTSRSPTPRSPFSFLQEKGDGISRRRKNEPGSRRFGSQALEREKPKWIRSMPPFGSIRSRDVSEGRSTCRWKPNVDGSAGEREGRRDGRWEKGEEGTRNRNVEETVEGTDGGVPRRPVLHDQHVRRAPGMGPGDRTPAGVQDDRRARGPVPGLDVPGTRTTHP
eukprot:scaffold2844_cov326-Pavlova_lutheri.AAC.24